MTLHQRVLPDKSLQHPSNKLLLDLLHPKAEVSVDDEHNPTAGYVQKTHPDLEERLHLIAANLPSQCQTTVYGYAVLVAPSGVIFAIAMGTASMAFRLPESVLLVSAAELCGKPSPLFPADFVAFDPWNVAVPTQQWITDLQYWCELAYNSQ